MTAIQRFKIALQESSLDINEQARILEGYEDLFSEEPADAQARYQEIAQQVRDTWPPGERTTQDLIDEIRR